MKVDTASHSWCPMRNDELETFMVDTYAVPESLELRSVKTVEELIVWRQDIEAAMHTAGCPPYMPLTNDDANKLVDLRDNVTKLYKRVLVYYLPTDLRLLLHHSLYAENDDEDDDEYDEKALQAAKGAEAKYNIRVESQDPQSMLQTVLHHFFPMPRCETEAELRACFQRLNGLRNAHDYRAMLVQLRSDYLIEKLLVPEELRGPLGDCPYSQYVERGKELDSALIAAGGSPESIPFPDDSAGNWMHDLAIRRRVSDLAQTLMPLHLREKPVTSLDNHDDWVRDLDTEIVSRNGQVPVAENYTDEDEEYFGENKMELRRNRKIIRKNLKLLADFLKRKWADDHKKVVENLQPGLSVSAAFADEMYVMHMELLRHEPLSTIMDHARFVRGTRGSLPAHVYDDWLALLRKNADELPHFSHGFLSAKRQLLVLEYRQAIRFVESLRM